jgi:hypothetical protein
MKTEGAGASVPLKFTFQVSLVRNSENSKPHRSEANYYSSLLDFPSRDRTNDFIDIHRQASHRTWEVPGIGPYFETGYID